jgi:pyrroloquinoline quinone (PQQ) biosynthesis protein C
MTNALNIANTRIAKPAQSADTDDRITQIRNLIERNNAALLEHEYFRRCRARQIDREQTMGIVKQLYCFSVFFERLLARRITEHSSIKDPRVLALARKHLREEIGHAELFRQCLETNGVATDEISKLSPGTFTKAMFGYLTVTIQHENEYVTNVAIMQVMESIGYHFFAATLDLLTSHGIVAQAIEEHAEADIEHANLGIDMISRLDAETLGDCYRIVSDVYRLMSHVLGEWLGTRADAFSDPPPLWEGALSAE